MAAAGDGAPAANRGLAAAAPLSLAQQQADVVDAVDIFNGVSYQVPNLGEFGLGARVGGPSSLVSNANQPGGGWGWQRMACVQQVATQCIGEGGRCW